MLTGQLRSRLLDAPIRWFTIAAGVLALGVSGLFGGFDKVGEPPLPTVEVNQVHPDTPWNITVHSVRVFNELEPLRHKVEGSRWLVVVATVEVTADESLNQVGRAVRIRGAEGVDTAEPVDVRRASDGQIVNYLHPNLPDRLGFFWEQRASAPMPTQLRVGLFGMRYERERESRLLGWRWDPSVRAVLTVPVDDRRGPA